MATDLIEFRSSPAEAKRVLERLIPDPLERTEAQKFLGAAIERAHVRSPTSWSLALFRDKVRLSVGRLLVFSLERDSCRIAVRVASLPSPADELALSRLAPFRSAPGVSLATFALVHLSHHRADWQEAFDQAVEIGVQSASRTPYIASHSPGAMAYLRDVLGRDLPNPPLRTAQPSAPGVATWLFQANPSKFRALEAILDLDELTWTARQHRNDIKVGDRAILWLAGPLAGAYAQCTVLTAPAVGPELPGESKYWQEAGGEGDAPRVHLRIDRPLISRPQLRRDLLADPVLRELGVIAFPNSTVYSIAPAQATRLLQSGDESPPNWEVPELILLLDHIRAGSAASPAEQDEAEFRLLRLLGRSPDELATMVEQLVAPADPVPSTSLHRVVQQSYDGRDPALQQDAEAVRRRLLQGGGVVAPRIWKIAPGEGAEVWGDCRAAGKILFGFDQVGDLSEHPSLQALTAAYRAATPDTDSDRSVQAKASMVWSFATDVLPGDIVVANRGKSAIVGLGRVIGPSVFEPERASYRHTRRVQWFDTEERPIPTHHGWMRTIVELDFAEYLRLLQPAGSEITLPVSAPILPVAKGIASVPALGDVYAHLAAQKLRFPDELVTSYLLSLKTKPFVILSGISGTGKTKLAQVVAEWAGTSVEQVELPVPSTAATDGDVWDYQLQPYNFRHHKIIVAREAEGQFVLPESGSIDVKIRYGHGDWAGRLGLINPDSRRLGELRLGKGLSSKLAETLKAGDWIRITVSGDQVPQQLEIDPLKTVSKVSKTTTARHVFISVRPDWLDGKPILGYLNPLTEQYQAPPFLLLVLRAHRELAERGAASRPYFVILDEMNLARVEQYLADILSASESRRVNAAGQVVQEPLSLHDRRQCLPLEAPEGWAQPTMCATCKASDAEIGKCSLRDGEVQLVPPRLCLPLNLHITGTVNVDETTHMFSPKVLDRANVLEFNRVDLDGSDSNTPGLRLDTEGLALGVSEPVRLDALDGAPEPTRKTLVQLNEVLEPYHLHFGYRVASEIAAYVRLAAEIVPGDGAIEAALDLQLLQKVLPKLHGPRSKLMEPLTRLLAFAAWGPDLALEAPAEEQLRGLLERLLGGSNLVWGPDGAAEAPCMFPRSARKLARMIRTLRQQGFVAFIE